MLRFSCSVLTLAYALAMVGFLLNVPEHVVDSDWPLHARNHALQGLFWVIGLCLAGIVIVWTAFREREMWAWWATLMIGLFLYGGCFLSGLITVGGAPGWFDDIAFLVLSTLHVVGLVAARKSSLTL